MGCITLVIISLHKHSWTRIKWLLQPCTNKCGLIGVKKPCYFKVFHSVRSWTSNISSIFQPNAHDILNISYMFRCVIHHLRGEQRITCSKSWGWFSVASNTMFSLQIVYNTPKYVGEIESSMYLIYQVHLVGVLRRYSKRKPHVFASPPPPPSPAAAPGKKKKKSTSPFCVMWGHNK